MSLLTFNGKTWMRGSKPPTHRDQDVEFHNGGRQQCHITFNPAETFGIDYLGLAPGSRIRLEVREPKATTCTAHVCAVAGVRAARAGATENTAGAPKEARPGSRSMGMTEPQVALEPELMSRGGTEPQVNFAPVPAMRGLPDPLGVETRL